MAWIGKLLGGILLASGIGIAAPAATPDPATSAAALTAQAAAPADGAAAERHLLLQALRARQFDLLEDYLGSRQRTYEADPAREADLFRSLASFAVADPQLSPLFASWRDLKPGSYVARAGAGAHHVALAWAWRGHAYIGETHEHRIEQMERELALAVGVLNESLALTPRPLFSLTELIGVHKMAGSSDAAAALLAEAERLDPATAAPRRLFVGMLKPRWGGSHAAMDAFAARVAQAAADERTRQLARELAVASLGDRAEISLQQGDRVRALKLYDEAAAQAGDDPFARARAGILGDVGQAAAALAIYDRLLAADADDADLRFDRARLLYKLNRGPEALRDLLVAAEAGKVEAMSRAGLILVDGAAGIPADQAAGMRWLERAAHFWDVDSAFALGKTWQDGIGVKADHRRALGYFRIAVAQGHGPAENELGLMLWYGRGTAADQDEAIRLWTRAANRNIWQARHNLDFFLAPEQRLKLALVAPKLAYSTSTWVGIVAVGIVVWLLLIVLLWRLLERTAPRRG